MTTYYGLDGQPIGWDRYVSLYELKRAARSVTESGESAPDDDPTRIGSDHVGEAWVSTVWLGLDHNFGSGPPLIFETMIFGGAWDDYQWRYSTKEKARDGHLRIVAALAEDRDPNEAMAS